MTNEGRTTAIGGGRAALPVGLLVAVLLPLLLMPLAAVFIFAFRGGLPSFAKALAAPEAFSERWPLTSSRVIAFRGGTRSASS